jgi:hypothetical protein
MSLLQDVTRATERSSNGSLIASMARADRNSSAALVDHAPERDSRSFAASGRSLAYGFGVTTTAQCSTHSARATFTISAPGISRPKRR